MRPSQPLFSVITVCLNAEKTLPRTLESMREQSLKDVEYLVIDGGSTDGTLALVEANRDVVHHVVSEKDRGISDAFNKGVSRARGHFVGILNADDWYEPSTLHDAAEVIASVDPDVVCGRQRYWDGELPVAMFDANPELLRGSMSVNHIASFSRRQLYADHGGFKLEYRAAMDYELYLRFYTRGARFVRTDAVLANMALGGTSDRNWKRAVAEVKQAQLENGVPYARAEAHYLFQMAKGGTRRAVQKVGGQRLVDFYRRNLGQVSRA
jgi:glycosyltransferase involved in cell wall biosynthesis